VCAARKAECSNCQHIFYERKKKEQTDWTKLAVGDYIKVVQGHGPYYLSKRGEKIRMSRNGVYKISGLEPTGIHAYGAEARNGGHAFIYMSKAYESSATGVVFEPHKIIKVKYNVNNSDRYHKKRR